MLKKSLIATALVISTFGAFAQAPATPSTVAPAAATAAVKPADTVKEKREEVRKVKHAKAKAKHKKAKAATAPAPAKSEAPAKQ